MGLPCKGKYIFVIINTDAVMRAGKVERVDGTTVFLEVAQGVYIQIDNFAAAVPENMWAYSPSFGEYHDRAKRAVSAAFSAVELAQLTAGAGIKVLVLESAVQGIFGGAANFLGVVAGAAGGIAIIAAAPSALGLQSLYNATRAATNSPDAAVGGAFGGAVGTVLGASAAVAEVSAAGAVAGLSGAGITSGLVALGGGSVASGGGGMAAGLAVVTGIGLSSMAVGFAVPAAAFFGISEIRLNCRVKYLLEYATEQGMEILV